MWKLNQLMCRVIRGLTGFNFTINVVQIDASICRFKSIRMFLFHCTNDYSKYWNCSCIIMHCYLCNDNQVKNTCALTIRFGPCNSSSFALIITKEQCYPNPLFICPNEIWIYFDVELDSRQHLSGFSYHVCMALGFQYALWFALKKKQTNIQTITALYKRGNSKILKIKIKNAVVWST